MQDLSERSGSPSTVGGLNHLRGKGDPRYRRIGILGVLFVLIAGLTVLLLTVPPVPDYLSAQWEPANSSNYTVSDREANGLDIRWIVIHDIEGSESSCIKWFQDSAAEASSHYVIGHDGTIYQMVAEKDIAWHAGNWAYNQHSIGIEHAGFADNASFTDAEYRASAKLVAFLMRKYNITLVRPSGIAPADPEAGSGVIGHDQVPDPANAQLGGGASHHYDPGRYWNWTYYMSFVSEYYNEPQESIPRSGEGLLDSILSFRPILLAALAFVLLMLAGIIASSLRAIPRASRNKVGNSASNSTSTPS